VYSNQYTFGGYRQKVSHRSINFLTFRQGGVSSAMRPIWIMGEKHEGYVLNKGFPGNNALDLLHRLKRSVLSHHPSMVIIMIGTNDMINPAKMLGYPVFRGVLGAIVRKIMETGSEVLLLSLPHVDPSYVLARHKHKIHIVAPNEKIDMANAIIREIAMERACLFLDINARFRYYHSPNRKASSLIRNVENSGFKDGVHPTPAGYRLIAKSIFDFLKQQPKRYKRIICFGDSITFGAFSLGMGTSWGRTYPAILKKLLFT